MEFLDEDNLCRPVLAEPSFTYVWEKKKKFGYCTDANVFVLEACRNSQLNWSQLRPVTCAAIELCLLRW